jgi:hypothetical protein
LSLLPWSCGKALHHGGKTKLDQAAHFMAARKQKEREREREQYSTILFKSTSLVI